MLLVTPFFFIFTTVFAIATVEDAHLTTPQLTTKYGYYSETHHVATPDGYILTVHRIPSNSTSKKVVFLQHGIMGTSAVWLINGRESLGFALADKGYDVWMGNVRVNSYTRRHLTLDPIIDPEFWMFSWHEIGTIDIPTMIDYILHLTQQNNLVHVGHSEGTTTFFVMMSMRPEYKTKVKAQISLAPVAFANYMLTPFTRFSAPLYRHIRVLTNLLGIYQIRLPSEDIELLCGDGSITQGICEFVVFLVCGFNYPGMNTTRLPVLAAQHTSSTAVLRFLHYSQVFVSGRFAQFDFGKRNLAIYGSTVPPSYNLSLVSTPVHIFYSRNDWVSSDADVMKLCLKLGKYCKETILLEDKYFNHVDYLTGIRAPELLYNKIISLIDIL